MAARLVYIVNDAAFFVSHRLPLGLRARAAGVDVVVVGPDGAGRDAIERAGLRFVSVPLDRSSTNPWGEARLLRALTAVLLRERPDLVHNVTIKPVIYGGLAARFARVPAVVSSVSGMGYVFIAKGMRAAARRAAVHRLYRLALDHPRSRVIFQNTDDRDAMVHGRLVSARDAVVVPGGSGVDLTSFDPSPPTGPQVVVLPGRMLRDKGVLEFAHAARRLRAAHPAVRFALVGGLDTKNPSALREEELEDLTADGAVEWWGHRTDMPAVLAQAHIVCLPSYREGTPKALLEAAAAGRAVVTTDVPGCRDAIRPNITGLLVEAGNADSLRQGLHGLLSDPERVASFGRAGRIFASECLGVDRVVEAVFDVYRMVAPAELVVALGQRDA